MEKKIAYLTIAGLWVYVILRSIMVPITIDEAATFFHYIQPQKWLPGSAHWDANNHILNSGLSILSYRMFGAEEWALRLPNVLAGLLYLVMAWKLAETVSDRMFRWSLFLGLSMCSFLVEYFGYTRGYGLSMAFLLFSVWAFIKWKESSSDLTLTLMLLSVGAMVFSNMSLLISGMLMVGLLAIQMMRIRSRAAISYALLLLASGAIFYPAVQHSFAMKERGLLYYGEGDSFWSVTVGSLSKYVFHPLGEWLIWLFPLMFGLAVVLMILQLKQTGIVKAFDHPAILPVALLLGNLFANVSMHHLLGVNYPEDRVALGYIPFLLLSLLLLTNGVEVPKLKWPIVVLSAAIPLQLLATANLGMCVLWDKDQYLPVLREITDQRKAETGIEPTVEGYRWRRLAYDYHNWFTGGKVSTMRAYSDNGYLADLVITENEKNYDLSAYQKLADDPWSTLVVYERKIPRKRVLVAEGTFNTDGQTDAQFSEFVNIPLPKDKAEGYLFVPDLIFESAEVPPRISMKGQVSDSEHQSIDEHEVALDRLRSKWKGESSHLDHSILLDTRDTDATSVKVFLWNREQQGTYAASGTWKLYALQ